MMNHKFFIVPAVLAVAILFSAAPSRAQISSTPPIVVRQKPPKAIWLKAVVIHADTNSIMVHDEANSLIIHTFTYSPKVHDKMENVLNQGGYQSGDKINILHNPGQDVALDFKGKPSKPL
jgi:hypothetical protein